MRTRISIVLACTVLFAAACQDSATEPVEQTAATAPEFDFMNGPDMSGVVVRGDAWFSGIFDYTRDEKEKAGEPWMVVMGYGIDDYPELCGGSGTSTKFVAQTIGAPGAEHAIEIAMRKDMGVTAFPFYEFAANWMSPPAGVDPYWYAVCETRRVGGGTAHGVATTTPAGKRYPGGMGFNVNGTIASMGQTYRLHWVFKEFGSDGVVSVRKMHIW